MKISASIVSILAIGFLLLLSPGIHAQKMVQPLDSTKQNKCTFYNALGYASAYYAGSLYILSETWYKGRERVSFHFYNDNKGYNQIDKFGHAFGAYVYSYIGFEYLLHRGCSRNEALLYGATLGLVLQTPVEIMDGIYKEYGFSWGDMAANTFGSALVMGQELLFREQLVKYKFSYSESDYSHQANGFLGENSLSRIFKDYNGHTYWFSMPINKITGRKNLPDWLSISIGYGANGMYGEFENITTYNGVPIPETERYRQYLFSLDIDWTRIHTNSKFLKIVFKGLTFVKLPFPALEYNSLGSFKGHWLYF